MEHGSRLDGAPPGLNRLASLGSTRYLPIAKRTVAASASPLWTVDNQRRFRT
jgi:hypothetical protein